MDPASPSSNAAAAVEEEESQAEGPTLMDPASPSNNAAAAAAAVKERIATAAAVEEERQAEGPHRNIQSVPFPKLFSYADTTDVFLMIAGTLGAVGNGLAQPLMTVIFTNVIQSFGETTDASIVVREVSKVALDFVYLALGSGLAAYLQVVCWMATGERQTVQIRNRYLKSLLRQEIGFFDKEIDTGEVTARMSGDMILIQDVLGEKVGNFIQQISAFCAGFVVAFFQGWQLTLVMLSMIPLLIVSGAAMATSVTKMASRGQAAYTEAAVIVEQTINSIRTVASFTGEKQSVKKYSKSLRTAYISNVQEGLVSGLGLGTMMLIVYCSYALGVWYGSTLILTKGYTGAKVINVIFAVLIGSVSLGQASPCVAAFAAGQVAAFKIFETINRQPEIGACDTTGKVLDDISGNIEFRDVCFAYPTRPKEQIFSRFSLFVEKGMTMALVGQSGSGKSTVINLIERFYDPQAGDVLIDGVNLKEYQLKWIRSKIGLVSQEPVLFASTIRDNIAYGKDDATIEEIRTALDLANASRFIERMPRGIDTMVGGRGILLSGGQKQRVAIARAILKDPCILLLDEATSALDAESERIVQEALNRVMTNRTTVLVAHRLSTVRNANTITVLHQGAIVEKGSHIELLNDPSGAYFQLIQSQQPDQELCQTSQTEEDGPEVSVDIEDQATPLNDSPVLRSTVENITNPSSVSFSSPGHDNKESTLVKPDTKVPLEQPKISIRRLAYLSKQNILMYLFGTAASIANGALFPIFGVLLSNVIVTFYQPQPKLQKDSMFWSLMFVMLGVMSLLAITSRAYIFAMAGSKLIQRIRLMTFNKVVHMEVRWFDDPKNSGGAIGARLSVDTAMIRSLVGDTLSLIVQNTTTLIGGLTIAFTANWQLSLIFLALIPLIGFNYWIEVKFMKGFSENAKVIYEEASQVAIDAVGNIRTVASLSAEDKVMELYKRKCGGSTTTRISQRVISGTSYGVSNFLLFCVDATCFYAAARLLQEGKTTFAEVFRTFLVLSIAAYGISQSGTLVPDSTRAKSAIASVFALLDQASQIDSNDDSGITIEDLKGNIEFSHVSFRYPVRSDVQIFNDLCLAIESGEIVALVGESGSGKSTVVSLLQRFYDPDSGHILLDGVELQKFQLKWLRQQMGLVSQEPTLFNDTIRANIAYGKEGRATEAEIIAAAKLANAHNFISSLQQGYDTLVGEQGILLSGGQKQRVAIARAILKNPKILLLDEATSALDVESENLVQDALDRMMVNRTTVVIAHRLSTIKGANLIAVLKNGVIIEKGEHEMLYNTKNGAYASLVTQHSRASS